MKINPIMLVVSVVLGVLAMLLGFFYLSANRDAVAAQNTQQAQTERSVEILTVKRELPADHKINPEQDLQVTAVPATTYGEFAQQAVKASEREVIRGKLTGSAVPMGAPLMYAHLAASKDITLAPDRRAISIDVSGADALQGILIPGDRVDIIAITPKQPEQDVQAGVPLEDQFGAIMNRAIEAGMGKDGFETEIILTEVRVLAIGDSLSGTRRYLVGRAGATGARGNTVTLDVSKDDALKLAAIGGTTRLRLVLCPPERDEGDSLDSDTAGSLGG